MASWLETPRRVWRSIFPEPLVPQSDRDRRRVVVHTLLIHFRPVQLPAAALRFTHTFGLGGSSLVLFLVLAFTGLLSLFVYEPSPDRAYASVQALQQQYLFGRLVRSLHHWSANVMVVVVVLHMLRVFLTGAFRGPRQFNWLVGCALLALVLGSNFTGYLLPWDQLSYWAVTISTSMLLYVPLVGAGLRQALLGGDELGRTTLVIFHSLHTTVLPALLLMLMALHFWRVRKAGGVIVPRATDASADRPEATALTLFVPNLLLREVAMALALLAGLLVLSVALEAPLGEAANAGMSPNPAKAPWYFAGFQELLLHVHPVFAVFVLPLGAALALLALPYLRYDDEPSGHWFLSRTGERTAGVAAALGAGGALAWILADAFLSSGGKPLLPPIVGRGLVPVVLLLAGLALVARWLRSRFSASAGERTQALFVLLFAAFAVMTVVGAWCRGAGMRLAWPWSA